MSLVGALLIPIAGALLALAIGRAFLIVSGLRKGGGPRFWALSTLQFSGLALVFAALVSPIWGISIAAAPIFGIWYLSTLEPWADFLAEAALWALIPTVPVMIAALVLPKLRVFTVIITGCIFIVSSGIAAEVVSKRLMCAAAVAQGGSSMQRNSVLWTVRNAPRAYQFGLHGYLVTDGGTFGWSYRARDWYPIPDQANYDLPPTMLECEGG